MPPEISFDELVARYEVVLLDAYGVLVHTQGALPGAARMLDALDAAQCAWFIVTNDASKLPETGAEKYARFGLTITPEKIITSGSLLTEYFRNNDLQGAGTVVLGPADSRTYVARAGGRVVPIADDAEIDVLVIADEAGYDLLTGLDDTMTALFRRLDAGVTPRLVLPNPDLIYPKGGGCFGLAAGSLAATFEAALELRYPQHGLCFDRLGKPHAPIFERAKRLAPEGPMVMVGDQLVTDIRGANAFGIDSVLAPTGLTKDVDWSELPPGLTPTFRLER